MLHQFHHNQPDDYDYDSADFCGCIIGLLIGLLLCSLLGSCGTSRSGCDITPELLTYVHDTTHVYHTQHDSIMLHDSVSIDRYLKGDTMFVTKYKERTQYRDRWLHDSIYVNRTDTVIKANIEKAPLSTFDSIALWIGKFLLLLLSIYALGLGVFYLAHKTLKI